MISLEILLLGAQGFLSDDRMLTLTPTMNASYSLHTCNNMNLWEKLFKSLNQLQIFRENKGLRSIMLYQWSIHVVAAPCFVRFWNLFFLKTNIWELFIAGDSEWHACKWLLRLWSNSNKSQLHPLQPIQTVQWEVSGNNLQRYNGLLDKMRNTQDKQLQHF